MKLKDELGPKFIQQPGWSMDIDITGSGIGTGVCFSFYDEYENDRDHVFIQSKSKIEALRDKLNEMLESDEVEWEEFHGKEEVKA